MKQSPPYPMVGLLFLTPPLFLEVHS
jgi:hypothetical protein